MEIESNYDKFLSIIHQILEESQTSFANWSKAWSKGKGQKASETHVPITWEDATRGLGGSPTAATRAAAKKLMRNEQDLIKPLRQEPFAGKERDLGDDITESWTALLEAINEYIILPVQSHYFIDEDKPIWLKGLPAMTLAIKNAKNNPTGKFLKKIQDKGITIEAGEVDELTEFLGVIRKGGKFNLGTIRKEGRDAVIALDSLFGSESHDINLESICGMIFEFADTSQYRRELGELQGMSIKELGEKYRLVPKSTRIKEYPILSLKSVVNTSAFNIMEDDEYFPEDVREAFKELRNAYKLLKMDPTNIKLLQAHDTIRKMEGKEVVWGMLQLDSIDHMDAIINKVDITATEINTIVKAVSSYESLALNHGVTEDDIYTIKAMFR